mmetsp:Transcript_140090/g.390514  ORF Transcript_140090/g.390514 Transcript_140090/m.390514 type:complete len:460 (+) Transcript_140090:153-1532(+)
MAPAAPQPAARRLSWLVWQTLLGGTLRQEPLQPDQSVDQEDASGIGSAYNEFISNWTDYELAYLAIANSSLAGNCKRFAGRRASMPSSLIDSSFSVSWNWTGNLLKIKAYHFWVIVSSAVEAMIDTACAVRSFCARVRSLQERAGVLGTWGAAWCLFRRRLKQAVDDMRGAEFFARSTLNRSLAEIVQEALPRALSVLMGGLANGKVAIQDARTALEHFLIVFFEYADRAEILGKEIVLFGRHRVARVSFHPEAADVGYDEGRLHRADVLLWILTGKVGPGTDPAAASATVFAPRVAELGVDMADCSARLLAANPTLTWLGVDAYGSVSQPGPEDGEGPRWLLEARKRLWPWLGTPRAQLVVGDSASAARTFAGNGRLDLLFVDGDHSRRGAARDLEAWAPHVRPGGVVAGHDYCREFPGVVEAVHAALPSGATLHLAPDSVFWWYAPATSSHQGDRGS